jgi:hypothetical protein
LNLIGKTPEEPIPSDLQGSFTLNEFFRSQAGGLKFPEQTPTCLGSTASMGRFFDFHGTLTANAKLSQMRKGMEIYFVEAG